MAGKVYLRTNRFEVKLEGITFKTNVFEYLCSMDFLFPDGKVWDRPPIVGLDVMRHPRDPSVLLVLLCFGVGCVILRFHAGEKLPVPIQKFLADKRIHFVGFGIPEKKDLFPFEELGLTKSKVDIGYLAAKVLKQPKCETWELAELARKVLGIKRMIGLTEASSFERHEQIKCAICQLFITSVIAMGLLRGNDKKKLNGSHKKSSFLRNWNLSSLHLLAEEWFKLPKGKKKNKNCQVEEEEDNSIHVHIGETEDMIGDDILGKESPFRDSFVSGKIQEGDLEDDSVPVVFELLQSENRDVKTALDVISANISAATFLASVCLTLSALIGAWIANNSNIFQSELIYGDTRPATMSIKYITLLICFLLAFSCFVQSSRWFIHSNYLISTPGSDISTEYVELAVIRGGDFWSVGLRALYFATTLLLWFFGPIPMFATSVTMVILLHYLDNDTTSLTKKRSHRKEKLKRLEEII